MYNLETKNREEEEKKSPANPIESRSEEEKTWERSLKSKKIR